MTDTTVRIAWLGLLDSDDASGATRAHDHLIALAQQVAHASGFGWLIELISCGGKPARQSISAGVDRVKLPVAGVAKTVWDRTSWNVPRVIADADLVHLHDGFSRSCELALLLAKQLRKPVCVTHWGIQGHWLTAELSLVDLADVVVCHNRAAVESVNTTRPVELIPCDVDIREIGVPAPWPANHCLPFAHEQRHSESLCRERGAPWAPWRSAGDRATSVGNSRNATEGVPYSATVDEPGDGLGRLSSQYAAAGKRLYDIYHRLIANQRRAVA